MKGVWTSQTAPLAMPLYYTVITASASSYSANSAVSTCILFYILGYYIGFLFKYCRLFVSVCIVYDFDDHWRM